LQLTEIFYQYRRLGGYLSNAGKAKLEKFCLLTLILLTEKDATFWLWHYVMANLVRKICTKLYQNRPRFVKGMTKTFGVFFGSLAKCDC